MLYRDWSRDEGCKSCLDEVVHLETSWRERPGRDAFQAPPRQITVSRWTDNRADGRTLTSVVESDYHIVSLALRSTEAVFTKNGRILHSGRVRSGALQVSGPGDKLRGDFQAPSDSLHLYIPGRVLSDCYLAMHGEECWEPITIADPAFVQDGAIEQLGRQLLAADDMRGPHGRLCADGLTLALAARLLSNHASQGAAAPPTERGLPKWRLKRARDYIEANLGEKLHLSDIAASTGLSRMHFAAQFRAATGMRPHEFVLRRRIERAQELIETQNSSLVDVALSVGFQTQAHFTTVFKQFVGETPSRWREYQGLSRQMAS